MRERRSLRALGLAAVLLLWASIPVAAHTLGGDVDAPLPFWAYLAGAAVAVALSFAFAALGDDRPEPELPPARERIVWHPVRRLLRATGLLAWAWVVAQAIVGGTSDAEVGPLLLWVFGWVGLALVSALVGPAWAWLDPFSTIYDLLALVLRPTGLHLPGRAPWRRRVSVWPAVIALVVFVWLELVGRIEDTRTLGAVLVAYTLVTLVGMAWYGRDRWREHGEAFSVWFGLLGRLAPWGLTGRREDGVVAHRGFGQALADAPWGRGSLALVAIGAGSVIWDGLSQTSTWYELVGRPHVVVESALLLGFLGLLVTLVLRVAERVGPGAMGAGLVPVTVGYLVAHYLTYLLTEGQRLLTAISDPLQQGWDLFGTVAFEPRTDFISSSLLWTLQVGAVVLGHVAGAWLGHAAVRHERRAGRQVSQWPLALLMIGMTVLALWSLGQNLVFVAEPVAAGA